MQSLDIFPWHYRQFKSRYRIFLLYASAERRSCRADTLSAAVAFDLGFGFTFDFGFDFLQTNPCPRVPHLCAFFAQRWDSTTVCSKSGD
jgi:hypothetical protein